MEKAQPLRVSPVVQKQAIVNKPLFEPLFRAFSLRIFKTIGHLPGFFSGKIQEMFKTLSEQVITPSLTGQGTVQDILGAEAAEDHLKDFLR